MATDKNRKVELLAPAGNMEKLEIAMHYGADAVYLGGKDFSLRNFSGNFSFNELKTAIQVAHNQRVKVYVACNIFSRNFEQGAIKDYLEKIGKIGPDAVIISDPGIFMTACEVIPRIPVHLSTQANTTNYKSVLFWEKLGVKRINIARELSIKEIGEITSRSSLEIEAFVHGAMCIAYSGRCLLSSFMTNRDSNRGICSHPCRWKYSIVEELRPGKYMPFMEDDRGSYIFNSRDLCMIEYIPEMLESGLTSLKIEGRMKGINYLASTVKVYREAIDAYYADPAEYGLKKEWVEELGSISNRGYCTGFYLGDPNHVTPNYNESKPLSGHLFIGKVKENVGHQSAKIEIRNKIFKGDVVEILKRKGAARRTKVNEIIDPQGRQIPFAQPGSEVTICLATRCSQNDLIRKIDPGN